MQPVAGTPSDDPVDRLIIELRAYVEDTVRRVRGKRRGDRRWTSGITVTFDTETTTDQSQRLRFGAYQVRQNGGLIERGVFHAEDMPAEDLEVLRATFAEELPTDDGEHLRIRSRAEFVDGVLYDWGLEAGGLIVGFNLPFDISRIAIDHTYGKRAFKGGFSFTLAEGRPNVRVKHLSQRASFIDFAGKDGRDHSPDRGFFVDVKTLAAALTSRSHSLQSLTGLLGVTPKSPLDSYDGPLTPEMVRYCLNDVQATWECFDALTKRYAAYGLDGTGLHELYSEASLGKAFLQAMEIEPWRQAQPDFPPELIGQVMSTYYGGRAEVHIRREIAPVIHCDFLSMYPTVCTLMGLWRFVIAKGVTWNDATEEAKRILETWTLDDLRDPLNWPHLACIVQVRPQADIFPVRARYERDQPATIGLNRLSSDEPMWFTLADVLAAKLLGRKVPEVVSAIRFDAQAPQDRLRTITLEGEQVRPEKDDFYKLLIDRRRVIQAAEDKASDADKPALKSAQQSLKILANSTSYGIFVELNVRDLDSSRRVTCYDFRGVGRTISTRKLEDTGRYYHPLLGTLITGAARLMLALAERLALDQGLDWAFCDTDSLAIANTVGLDNAEFVRRVEEVRAWFEPLNPYERKGAILQLEKVNYPPDKAKDPDHLRPVNCLAISAKRYVLFDRDADGAPVIRKASAHGLGHLVAPYPDPERPRRIDRLGVELWQEDLWREIIQAFDRGEPDQVDFGSLRNFDEPAASRYAATNQTLLAWFSRYNATVEPRDRVWPFNFLLSFQAKSRMEMAAEHPEALASPAWRRREPHPASRYSSDLQKDRPPVFDRERGEPVPWDWLKSVGRSLARHHLHSENKFQGGADDNRGTLRRRHVRPLVAIPIGKEADNLEEREAIGETDDTVEWAIAREDRARLLADIKALKNTLGVSDRTLIERAGVSHHTLADIRNGRPVAAFSLLNLTFAAEELRKEAEADAAHHARMRGVIIALSHEVGGRDALAALLGYSKPFVGRLMSGGRSITTGVLERLRAVFPDFETRLSSYGVEDSSCGPPS